MTTNTSQTQKRERSWAAKANRLVYWLSRHWLLVFTVTWGMFIGLPFLAPMFMKAGWSDAARIIYFIYSLECHQLPQRSFFLFGPKMMYSLPEIQAAWQPTNNPFILRQFIGNAEMGWKVAWCERTTWWYGSIWIGALIYGFIRGRLSSLQLSAFILSALPMALDGGTHFISDLAGIGSGFRDNNAWLATLTHNIFPTAFYMGDALGSFNSWMRLTTGVVLGLTVVWYAFPQIEATMNQMAHMIEFKFQKADLSL